MESTTYFGSIYKPNLESFLEYETPEEICYLPMVTNTQWLPSNASTMEMTYASATRAILSENAWRKSFEQSTSGEAYTVQDTGDRHHRS